MRGNCPASRAERRCRALGGRAGTQLLHITDDPAEAARAPVGDSLLGDSALLLAALMDLLGEPAPAQLARRTPPRSPNGAWGAPPTAAQVFAALNELRPAHAVLVEESPSNHAALHEAWPVTEPDSYYTFASGGLGWNLPASVGIALAERESGRDRPVVVIIGDGSMQYSIQSIWSAARLRLPILIVVIRNGDYAILKSFAELEGTPGVPGLDLPGLDIVSLAQGYGCYAVDVEDADALEHAVASAWTRDVPTVLEVPVVPEVPPLV